MNDQRTKSSREELEERLEQVEELLCAGVALERVQRKIADDYGVSTRQARNYITKVYERWRSHSRQDAPHRREKLFRMAERFYARALANKQYTAASNALALLAKMSGAFTAQEPNRETILAELGPVPDDPTSSSSTHRRRWCNRCAKSSAIPPSILSVGCASSRSSAARSE